MTVSGELVVARDRNIGNSVRFINDMRSMDISRSNGAVPSTGSVHRYKLLKRASLALLETRSMNPRRSFTLIECDWRLRSEGPNRAIERSSAIKRVSDCEGP